MKILLLLALLVDSAYSFKIDQLVPRKEKQKMTTSVIVPCVARHFLWVSGLLESYENQTVKPDEVVISLSEVEKLNPKEINDIEAGLWSFKLKVIRNKGVVIDGDNRTIAMDNSSGDVLIFSDADDVPHPQRVEISKFIFENYEIDHILHSMCNRYDFKRDIKMNDLEFLKFKKYDEVWNYCEKTRIPLTTGSPCFLRKIGERVKWTAINDQAHARAVYNMFPNTILLCEGLIFYRVLLSSHGNRKI